MKKSTRINSISSRFLSQQKGFTLIELLIGGSIMLIVILAALLLYMNSNKIAVDQQQYAEIQHSVRSGMYLMTRDIRMAGAGLPPEFGAFYIQGFDNENQGEEVTPDRLRIMGNLVEPLELPIQQYQGSAATITIEDHSFEKYPYNAEAGTENFYTQLGIVLVLPNPASGCLAGEIREITQVLHSEGGTNEGFNFAPGLAPGINPPGGLSGTCPSSNDYDGGTITFINVKEYWLDITGNYPGLTPGENGYIGNGEGGILYITDNAYHYPLAQNIENLQFEYNADFDGNGILDGFTDWQDTWTPDQIKSIYMVRIFILGRTPNPFVSISDTPPADLHVYKRPATANMPAGSQHDFHRRFLLESTATLRANSLNLYNFGTR